MHLHFERSTNARSDCAILSLTWMGKVPDEIPDDDGWKLNRTNYYQEGWLASGNVRGIVGVTFTTCHCKKIFDSPLRTNYNLRGHRSEVTLVKWNEPYQKLASCDSSGIIFVWIKYEGRWSIELINDRNTQVTDFSWSHDGRMALICYQDGFVLVGSVAGQRYWSSMLNLDGTITCGVWTPDDQQVFFGTTDGHIIVMDVHGTMVAQVAIMEDVAISGMAWSCEKFKMEETDDMAGTDVFQRQTPPRPVREDKPVVLTICFHHGVVYLMKNYDDLSPTVIHTGLRDIKIEWSNSGEILAVSGTTSDGKPGEYQNVIQFFNGTGVLRYSVVVPNTQNPVSALTWGHNDKRLFVATGCLIHIAWVNRKVASLQFLCRLAVHGSLHDENQVAQLPIPHRLCSLVSSLFAHTIKCYVPHPSLIREFVNRPPSNNSRLHCTMIRHDDDLNLTSGACYTLYLEYLGGLVPLLKGKRTSKIRPEFVIYDPQVPDASSSSDSVGDNSNGRSPPSLINGAAYNNSLSDYSDSEYEDSCASPRMQRRRRQRRRLMREQLMDSDRMIDELAYIDTLPEQEKLVEVTSNIWGTKFKIHGISSTLPANLGQVTYKTSLLHLQPRQMTVVMTELRDDLQPERDPNFNPNVFSEDEDEQLALGDGNNNINGISTNRVSLGYKESIPIAPMTPRRQIPASRNYSRVLCNRPRNNRSHIPGVIIHGTGREIPARFASLAQPEADSESDEYSYVDFTAYPEFVNLMEANRRLCASAASSAASPASSPCPSPLPARRESERAVVPPVERLSVQVDLGAVPKLRGSDDGTLSDDSSVSCSVTPAVVQPEVHTVPSSLKSAETPKVQKDGPSSVQSLSSSRRTGSKTDTIPRWAERARGLKYIDDDDDATLERILRASSSNHHVYQTRLLSKYHSRSVGQLNSTDILTLPAGENFRTCSLRETKRRLILSPNRPCRPRTKLQYYGKSRSLDSGILSKELLHTPPQLLPVNNNVPATKAKILFSDLPCAERVQTLATQHVDSRSLEEVRSASALQSRFGKSDSSSDTSPLAAPVSKSVSSTPTHTCKKQRPKSSSPIRRSLLNSPLLSRKSRRTKVVESSDEEMAFSGDEILTHSFKDLENFQKARIRQKLKRGRNGGGYDSVPGSPTPQRRREFVMYNKAPLWNENSQVYQLDFGGRVTQESAKNFQIEFKGKQVMQFGRIDGNAYTLDFQYPFTAIQAFAVALANVTQRLK